MPRFRKKPVEIEAVKWTGLNKAEITEFCSALVAKEDDDSLSESLIAFDTMPGVKGNLFIKTLEGVHKAIPGDWIIKGVAGEFYPCKPDIFEQTYDAV